MSIKIYYDNVKFRLKESGKIKSFLNKVINSQNKTTGDLIFIFTGDKNIRKINREFLNHDYYTDVISFRNGSEHEVSGEIYIGIETVRRNANLYNVSQKEEVLRIMIHGILHLLGYVDSNIEGKKKMIDVQEDLVNDFKRLNLWNSDTKLL